MSHTAISSNSAPEAIGVYSQAVRVGDTVYLSGQIPLVPETMALVSEDPAQQIKQVFDNLSAVAEAANASLADINKLGVYLTDLSHFALVNEIMTGYFVAPYPARAVVGVSALPRNALVEMDAILTIR